MVCWTPLTTIWPVWARKNIKSQTAQCVTNALSGTCLHVTSILAQKHGVRNGDSDHCVRVYDVYVSKNPSSNHALHRQGPSTSCQHLLTCVNSVVGLLECLQEAINSVLHQLLACVQHGSRGVVTAWCSNPILWRWPRFHAMHLAFSIRSAATDLRQGQAGSLGRSEQYKQMIANDKLLSNQSATPRLLKGQIASKYNKNLHGPSSAKKRKAMHRDIKRMQTDCQRNAGKRTSLVSPLLSWAQVQSSRI